MTQSPIVKGLREQYPGYEDIPDSEFVDSIRGAYYQEMPQSEFLESLESAYGGKEPPKEAAAKPAGFKETMKSIGSEMIKDATGVGSAMGKVAAKPALEQGLSIPDMSLQDLLKRGYSPEVARNVLRQRTATQQEMSGELADIGAAGQEESAQGSAALLSMIPGAAAEQAVVKGLGPAAVKGAGWVAKHAAGGAAGVGSYEATKAAMEGKPAGEVFSSMLSGAVTGAIASPLLAAPVAGIRAVPRYIRQKMSIAAARQRQLLENTAREFATKFKSGWLKERFQDMFDPNVDPNTLAMSIMIRVLGQDVAEIAPKDAIESISQKIMQAKDLGAIDPSFRPLTTAVGPTEFPRPTLDPMVAPGTMAPEPNAINMGSMASPETPQQMPVPQPQQPVELDPSFRSPMRTPQNVPQMPGMTGTAPEVPTPPASPQEQVQGAIATGQMQQEATTPLIPSQGLPPENLPSSVQGPVSVPPPAPAAPGEVPQMQGLQGIQEEIMPSVEEVPTQSILGSLLGNKGGSASPPTNPLVEGARSAIGISGTPEEKVGFRKATKSTAMPAEGLERVNRVLLELERQLQKEKGKQ